MNYSLYTLGQLEHMAYCEDNHLALAIYQKGQEEKEEAVEKALEPKCDSEYSYEISDAVNTIQYLLSCKWDKEENGCKDEIVYILPAIQEDTSPYQNNVKLWRYKGSNSWRLEVNHGEYGEEKMVLKIHARGFRDAQTQAVEDMISAIKGGMELNV